MALEVIQQLMTEMGPLVDAIQRIEQSGKDAWAIVFDEQFTLFLCSDELARKVTFSVDVGKPPAESRQRAYSLFLTYNSQWQQTGGLRLALDPENEHVLLLLDLFLLDLNVATLATVVENLLEKARTWHRIIVELQPHGLDEAPLDELPGPGELPSGSVIRV